MKLNINYIYSFLFLLTLSTCAFLYHNNSVLESRINTIVKNSNDFSSEKTFKEDYYITQQSHDTNVLLIVFGSLVAISGIFNYLNLRDQYNNEVQEIKRETAREMEAFRLIMKESEDELDNFKNQYYLERVDLDTSRANNYLDKGDIENYVVYNLSAANKICDFYRWAVKNDEELDAHSSIIDGLIELLTRVNVNIGEKVNIDKIQVDVLDDYFYALRLVNNKKLNKIISMIDVKINKTAK
ncbi:hypothetical protein NJT12_05040 [Flavobacterium sp. AC]|uniref:Lipoprotein n=1 Tax=Flavobacterium azizsancarii TaxID=2961580 RepID=A0ABT4W8W7_9FLAO|nr:hypothetical protein [Flavobacterium azizsancarii]MDA6068983.1 hypothetical protein [Flavobacterium azizsancarii]